MKDYLVTTGDVFGVEKRIREIDDGYRIFYNKKLKRFEIHNLNQKSKDTLCLVVPFDQVDQRIIPLVRKSRVERMSDILREVDEHNLTIETRVEEMKSELQKKLNSIKNKLM